MGFDWIGQRTPKTRLSTVWLTIERWNMQLSQTNQWECRHSTPEHGPPHTKSSTGSPHPFLIYPSHTPLYPFTNPHSEATVRGLRGYLLKSPNGGC